MRLLNTYSLRLRTFSDESPPQYAVLSHTWNAAEDEVDFADITLGKVNGQWPGSVLAKKGFSKVKRAASVAMDLGYEHIWIDTCCINKDSNQELQTAINSMFKWYQNSAICIVYLEDFEFNLDVEDYEYVSRLGNEETPWHKRFKQSRWFTRGWTLQELIAPKELCFYDRYWTALKRFANTAHIQKLIEERTHVPRKILENQTSISSINIATRMRWAANRQTTRGEDRAYSLLGIFDVSMPLLYGEGKEKAFLRLQEEIIKRSEDETIFAWAAPRPGRYGLLAKSPDWFVDCRGMKEFGIQQSPWTQSNKGLHVALHMSQSNAAFHTAGRYTVFLNRLHPVTGKCPSFTLEQLGNDKFARNEDLTMRSFPKGVPRLPTCVPQEPPERAAPPPAFFHVGERGGGVVPYLPADGWNTVPRGIWCSQPSHLASQDSYIVIALITEHHERGLGQEVIATITLLIRWFETVGRWGFLSVVLPGRQMAAPEWPAWASTEVEAESTKAVTFCQQISYDRYKIEACGYPWAFEGGIGINISVDDTRKSSRTKRMKHTHKTERADASDEDAKGAAATVWMRRDADVDWMCYTPRAGFDWQVDDMEQFLNLATRMERGPALPRNFYMQSILTTTEPQEAAVQHAMDGRYPPILTSGMGAWATEGPDESGGEQ